MIKNKLLFIIAILFMYSCTEEAPTDYLEEYNYYSLKTKVTNLNKDGEISDEEGFLEVEIVVPPIDNITGFEVIMDYYDVWEFPVVDVAIQKVKIPVTLFRYDEENKFRLSVKTLSGRNTHNICHSKMYSVIKKRKKLFVEPQTPLNILHDGGCYCIKLEKLFPDFGGEYKKGTVTVEDDKNNEIISCRVVEDRLEIIPRKYIGGNVELNAIITENGFSGNAKLNVHVDVPCDTSTVKINYVPLKEYLFGKYRLTRVRNDRMALEEIKKIEKISLYFGMFFDFPELKYFTGLKEYGQYASYNYLNDSLAIEMDFTNCELLENLHLNYQYSYGTSAKTNVRINNLKGFKELFLHCDFSKLEGFDVTNYGNLEFLSLENTSDCDSAGNSINLDFSNSPKLSQLSVNCDELLIDNFDVSHNTKLSQIEIWDFPFNEIDLSNNVNLKLIDVHFKDDYWNYDKDTIYVWQLPLPKDVVVKKSSSVVLAVKK